ncbi:unnamed protein product [Pleuronectes platessa]|uniref:Uncharacterized protein n=1 Tax=Pleuronectes platessa TaxID=8262 RepID=A0A9N7W0U4_PLEPL|nr:unnamed protein product [Pleuronectes platessa]
MHSTAVSSSNLFEGNRLALGGPRSLQWRSAVGGRGERSNPAPLQPAHRHHPPARSTILYVGSRGAFWGPRNLKRVPAAGCARWRGGVHSGSLTPLQRAPRNQPRVHPESHSLPVPLQSLPRAGCFRLTSLLFRRQRSSRRLHQSLSRTDESRLTSLLCMHQRS